MPYIKESKKRSVKNCNLHFEISNFRLYICMWVCVCVRACIHTRARARAHTHTHTHIHVHKITLGSKTLKIKN